LQSGPKRFVQTSRTVDLLIQRKTHLESSPGPRQATRPLPDVRLTSFDNWNNVAAWYASLQKLIAGPRIFLPT
jgi:hypothetical protein